MLGTPYIWGGSHPYQGIDCSGLVQVLLKSSGEKPPGDLTAQGIYNHFALAGKANVWGLGSLAFFGADYSHVTHVAFMVNNYQMIEAGHGDHTCTTVEIANKRGAYVRLAVVRERADFLCVIRPQYSKIGMI